MKIQLFSIFTLLVSTFAGAQEIPGGLKVGDTAPDFSANDQFGKTINLNKILKKGPVVLLFYRGQWCPFCNKQLNSMQDSIMLINSKKGTVIAVTPEKPENISKTIEKTKASYSILFDDGLKIMNSYDVSFKVDGAALDQYKSYGIDFDVANGSNGANLPIPAVYIIGRNGKITYRHFDPDFRKRPSIKEIASHL